MFFFSFKGEGREVVYKDIGIHIHTHEKSFGISHASHASTCITYCFGIRIPAALRIYRARPLRMIIYAHAHLYKRGVGAAEGSSRHDIPGSAAPFLVAYMGVRSYCARECVAALDADGSVRISVSCPFAGVLRDFLGSKVSHILLRPVRGRKGRFRAFRLLPPRRRGEGAPGRPSEAGSGSKQLDDIRFPCINSHTLFDRDFSGPVVPGAFECIMRMHRIRLERGSKHASIHVHPTSRWTFALYTSFNLNPC